LCLCGFLVACSAHPTQEERALVSGVEKQVVLPKGGGNLQCYERHYVLLKGEQAKTKMGGIVVPGGRVLFAEYLHGRDAKPGVYWADSEKEMPAIADAGCSVVEVWYVPGVDRSPKAWCSANIAGVNPAVIVPPVTC
jgi:hypothetical protein